MVITAIHDGSLHDHTAKLSDEAYRRAVLRAPSEVSEDEVDAALEREARQLGVPVGFRLDPRLTSASLTTLDSQELEEARPPPIRPTLFTSESFQHPPPPPPLPVAWRRASSTLPVVPKRSSSLFKSFSRITTLRIKRSEKHKSVSSIYIDPQPMERMLHKQSSESCFSAQTRNDSWSTPASSPMEPHAIDRPSRPQTSVSVRPQTSHSTRPRPSKELPESCFSAQSKISSWSVSPTLAPSPVQEPVELEVPESPGHAQLQAQQFAERDRFLEYQRTCLRNLRLGMEQSRKGRQEANATTIEERRVKHETAMTTLESRQLEAELKLINELEDDHRTCHIRLRHMEAYCHSPSRGFSPPHTPLSVSDRSSLEQMLAEPDMPASPSPRPSLSVINTSSSFLSDTSSSDAESASTTPTDPTPSFMTSTTTHTHISALPQSIPSPLPLPPAYSRTVTDKDFTLLARQYRLRDTLSTRHRSRIAVLRGRQEKAVEILQAAQTAEIADLETKLTAQTDELMAEWEERRDQVEKDMQARASRLKWRWDTESRVCQARKNGLLPPVPPKDDEFARVREIEHQPSYESLEEDTRPMTPPAKIEHPNPIVNTTAPSSPIPFALFTPPPVSASTIGTTKYATAPSSPASTPLPSPRPEGREEAGPILDGGFV